MSTCPHCGKSVSEEAKFCESCGCELAGKKRQMSTMQKALAACAIVLAVAVVVLGVMVMTRSKAQHGVDAAEHSAEKAQANESTEATGEEQAAPSTPQITYTWSHEKSGGDDSASTDIWWPVFSVNTGDTSVVEAMNEDAEEQAQTARDSLASWKSWAYVWLFPEVTLHNEEYVAVHYYHIYNAGTEGTLSIAGEGALYSLADGGKSVSPAVMLGITDDELFNMARNAMEHSGVYQKIYIPQDLDEKLEEGTAGYVVLSDGVYLYLKGVNATDRDRLSFCLVCVCDLEGNEPEQPTVVDLASDQQKAYYHDLSREAENDESAEPTSTPNDDHEQLRAAAQQRGEQVFEGVVHVYGGEDVSAISGVPLTANGESVAQKWRNATYVVLELDNEQTVDVNMLGMDSYSAEYRYVGLGRNDYSHDGELLVDSWTPYDGKRICVATSRVGNSQGVDLFGPWLYGAEVLYEES